jgi:uncharacterized protein
MPVDAEPEFFRRPPPPGRSRESTIRLDANGRFWHEGFPVEHAGVARAFAQWLARHPDNGRYVLANGYDWTYLTVEGAPLFVERLSTTDGTTDGQLVLHLSDGTAHVLDAEQLWIGERDAVFADVRDGTWRARFSPAAQL